MPISLRLFRTSTFRLALIYLAVFAVSVGAILGYVYWNTTSLIERHTDEAIEAELRSLAVRYGEAGTAGVIATIDQRARADTGAIYLIANSVGRKLAGNLNGVPTTALRQDGWVEFAYASQGEDGIVRHMARAYTAQLPGGYRLIVGRDIEERRQIAAIIRNSMLWALALTAVLGLGGGLLMSRSFLSRIEAINATARAIMKGDLAQRMPLTGSGDELDRLASELNAMLERIETLMKGMREVSSNVAHDLRTPLTRLRASAEDALRQKSPARYRAALERTLAEADGLLATFNALLSITRAEAGEAREGFAAVDAGEIMTDLADLYRPLIEDMPGRLDLSVEAGAILNADRQLLAQALTNLIDNAIKYARPNAGQPAHIELKVASHDDDVDLVVADNGPGVAEAERERVKQRFVRLESERRTPGSGLGLALADSVARLHGGQLILEDNSPGLVAILRLPRSNSDTD